ncbi:MAG TPA: PilZ domain-containing protein [Tepidisphaeraceae bacterium]|nr:PilZ domain-containing protein [Tepidisphaeraceae bacterium]
MGMFSDDFPFTKRQSEVESQAPVVEAQPLAADAFPDDFPFTKRVADAPTAPPAVDARWALTPASSIFPPGFPFAEPQPETQIVSAVEAAPQPQPLTELTAEEIEALAPSPAAPILAPAPLPAAPLPFKDRRRSPRQRMHAKATLRVDTIGGNPLHVEIDNLSLLGVRIRTTRELLTNDKANLRLEVGPLKWATRLRVINCLRNGDASYTIGCEFVGNELARGRVAA